MLTTFGHEPCYGIGTLIFFVEGFSLGSQKLHKFHLKINPHIKLYANRTMGVFKTGGKRLGGRNSEGEFKRHK